MKVQILTSRAIGDACADWAYINLPKGWELSKLTSFLDETVDVVISILFERILKSSEIKGKRVYNFH